MCVIKIIPAVSKLEVCYIDNCNPVVAKRKTLFDDRPLEIAELTHVIKQDIAALNSQISALQSLQKGQLSRSSRGGPEQEGEHNKNVRQRSCQMEVFEY